MNSSAAPLKAQPEKQIPFSGGAPDAKGSDTGPLLRKTNQAGLTSAFEIPSPKVPEAMKGVGNPDIHRELQVIAPIHLLMPMPDLLEVFKQFPQYTFFPVVDDLNQPRGIIREQRLKKFVYSRFGSTLLENPVLKNKLSDFIEPCTIVDIHDRNEEILRIYSQSETTEGVIVTADATYLGVISLRSLVKLGHERELSLQESHNRILEQRNSDINNILRNMKQGILTIQEDGTIHPDYSAYVETIFETAEIEGRHYRDLLFQRSNLSKDKLSQIRSALENSLGEDVMVFEVNSHLLVERYRIVFENNREKHLELFWNPIVDENERIRRFVINIREITELVALQEKSLQQQKEFKIISQVFSLSHDSFEAFIQSSDSYVQSCLDLLTQTTHFNLDVIAHVFRNLHTIKGNSRLYGFDDLTNTVHDVEEEVDRVRSRQIPYDNQHLIQVMLKVKETLNEYSSVIASKLQGFLATKQKGVFLDDQLFNALKDTILTETCADLSGSIQTIVRTQKILSAHHTVSLAAVFEEINASITAMAEIVGKPKPTFLVTDNTIRVSRETASILKIVIMHSIRNSLSHGIEAPDTRQSIGKDPTGSIHLVARLSEEQFTIEYWDDGAGLNLKKIFNKARESGLIKLDKPLGAKQLAHFIFCPGLSTADKVTEIAGRGVGMDAILKAIKSIGGSIFIVFQDKVATDPALKPFKFCFTLPVTLAQTLD